MAEPEYRWYSPTVTYYDGTSAAPWESVEHLLGYNPATVSPAKMWRTQPHLRTVVEFLCRNVAQLGLHVYERQDSGGRERADGSPLALLLEDVDGDMTTYDLVFSMVGDFLLYDVAYWVVSYSTDGWYLFRLPPTMVTPAGKPGLRPSHYRVTLPDGSRMKIRASYGDQPGVVRFRGYSPTQYNGASSKVEALRQNLQEQLEAAAYRAQLWKNGGRVSAVLERPADAEPWSDAARESFREDWYATYTGKGPKAGGTPILEDGMKLTRIDFNAREQQFVEASKLSLQTVAGVYHVNPTMIGAVEGASYSNVKEYSRMLYTDTLGPLLKQITQRVNKSLLPILGMERARFYAEFNIQEKLAGSFEEQAAVMSSSTGGPWMTTNEARARQNLPALPGGDQLIVPLNVTVGGQASPRDSGTQNETPDAPDRATSAPPPKPKALPGPREAKSRRTRTGATEAVQATLEKFFQRQYRVLKSRKATASWDTDRWNTELTEELLGVSRQEALKAAHLALAANGLGPEAYSEALTIAYLRESAARKAEAINEGTRERLEAAMETEDDEAGDRPDPYTKVLADEAEGRAKVWGAAVAGFVVGFAMTEAARQNGGTRAVKTWRTTSGNPRSSHAAMEGETVPVDDTFSNGLTWPASFGDPDEVAGCMCEVDVSW